MLRLFAMSTGTVALGLAGLYAIHLGTTNSRVLNEFEELAANQYYHVVAEPLGVRAGLDVRAAGVSGRLARAGLRRVNREPSPGEYRVDGDAIHYKRVDRDQQDVVLELGGNLVSAVRINGDYADLVLLPPEHLTSFRESLHERRAPVEFAALPPSLVTAVLAAEDRRFFDHRGLDWRGITRALARNLTHGKVVEGGSTVTQQTVKIILHRTRRELPAKIDEAMLALLVERRFTKQQILQVYLNNVYLGHEGPFDVHGVAEGARFFFDKPLADCSDSEMIELAAAIRAPNAASPRRHRERLESYTKAIAKRVPEVSQPGADSGRDADDETATLPALETAAQTAERLDFQKAQMAYFFDLLDVEWQEMRKQHHIEPPATIVASVDPVLQLRAAQGLDRGLESAIKRKVSKSAAPLQGAVAAVDPTSGAVRALVGGRDYTQAPFNRAFNMSRQVGSTFKPFVYLTALGSADDDSLTQSTQLPDEPREYQVGRTTWSPANSDGQFRGPISARLALEQSINTATVALGMGSVSRRWRGSRKPSASRTRSSRTRRCCWVPSRRRPCGSRMPTPASRTAAIASRRTRSPKSTSRARCCGPSCPHHGASRARPARIS
jgi:penicillin-binding protein 1B